MKSWRWLMSGLLLLALGSCGLFFAPLEGRWNPLDPAFGDGYTETALYPALDGYVDSMSGSFTDGTENLVAGMSGYDYRALMKFDPEEIPEQIPHAELRLYLTAAVSPEASFRVRLILEDWDQSVAYLDASEHAFVASLASPSLLLSAPGSYAWDVTALLQSVAPASFKGLLVEAEGAASMSATFYASEYPTDRPHLMIWTR